MGFPPSNNSADHLSASSNKVAPDNFSDHIFKRLKIVDTFCAKYLNSLTLYHMVCPGSDDEWCRGPLATIYSTGSPSVPVAATPAHGFLRKYVQHFDLEWDELWPSIALLPRHRGPHHITAAFYWKPNISNCNSNWTQPSSSSPAPSSRSSPAATWREPSTLL